MWYSVYNNIYFGATKGRNPICATSLTYHTMSRRQLPSSVFFVFMLWSSESIERQEINNERGDWSPALLFIEPKASGMTGITNSADHAAYLFTVCIKKQLRLLTVSFAEAELDWDHCLKSASPTLWGLMIVLTKSWDLPIFLTLRHRLLKLGVSGSWYDCELDKRFIIVKWSSSVLRIFTTLW